jgi:hypothetical protein
MTTVETVIVTVMATLFVGGVIALIVQMTRASIDNRHEKTAQRAAQKVFTDWSYRAMRDEMADLRGEVYQLKEAVEKKKAKA